MNDLAVFTYKNHEIREITDEKGNPWFVAKDVCEALEMAHNREAISRLHNGDVRKVDVLSSQGTRQQTNIINEAGLYFLILRSNKPEARKFQYWITHEVIPSIRKTGAYAMKELSRLEILEMAIQSERERIRLEQQIEANAYKIESFQQFIDASNYQGMNEVAKVLGYGRNKLFKLLRNNGVLRSNNTPYQRYLDRGYFVVKNASINMGGEIVAVPVTHVSTNGMEWLRNLLKREFGAAVRDDRS